MKEKIAESCAFRLEYQPQVLDREVREDVISYLWEYRFSGQKYDYSLSFKNGKIADVHRGEAMETKAERAIRDRKERGLSTAREEAELTGIKRFEEQLGLVKGEGAVVWASPPGSAEDGYGDYGFLYVGKVKPIGFDNKEIAMTAIRVENPTIEGFNEVFSDLLESKVEAKNPEDFISSPIVLERQVDTGYIEQILYKVFSYKEKSGEKEMFARILKRLNPLITDFTNFYGQASPEERQKALYALENYALILRREESVSSYRENIIHLNQRREQNLAAIVPILGYEPPKVFGSCGSTKTESNNLFGPKTLLNSLLEDDNYGSRTFKCPRCGQVNIRPRNELVGQCQHCQSDEVSCSHS